MRRALFVLVIALLAPACFAGTTVRLTGAVAADFAQGASAQEVLAAFSQTGQKPLLAGFGWEVVIKRFGFGGTYLVDFFQDDTTHWWLDWSGKPIYLSYHFFGGGAVFDPFIQVGAGCSGRVSIDHGYTSQQPLFLSLYPFAGAGLALDLEGFTFGAKVDYIPFASPPPATHIPAYPLGSVEVTIFAGVTLGR